MASVGVKSSYWKGVRDALPFTLVIIPFATLFGVVSSDAGLNVLESLGFSIAVIAGAAQFTALQLMRDEAPTLVVLASALAVNLRMAMYSASLTPHLGHLPLWKRAVAAYLTLDQNYALSIVEFERNTAQSTSGKFAYFLGSVTPIAPFWYGFTVVGALVGSAIPMNTGLDFAMPIAFIAMIGPALNSGAHRMAALVASVAALLFVWMPWNFGLLVAAGLGMATGAEIERRAEARA
ncbi:branched-chain amino acid transporter AzlC [Salipiger aestuarii]|uniref:Putative branched-subunit amino acid permease n=1 Tax=Salipiger aestuarii TaxID=568098 RepID=A0A327YAX9_9RHOB|nr:AzlC family ABC transporter permease [Salipiger aestuarii]KAB2542384.1 branched-chain amino acid transporter AzlC [Salipiger aestuarii]RAK18288.1 putative branched-subunit amino acid permease [Salipiger aestuarii]